MAISDIFSGHTQNKFCGQDKEVKNTFSESGRKILKSRTGKVIMDAGH